MSQKTLAHLDCDTRAVPACCLVYLQQRTSRKPARNAKSRHKTRKIMNYSIVFAKMKKNKNFGPGDVGVIFFVLRGSVRCLHFVLRYYCTVRDLHCSHSKWSGNSCCRGCGGQYRSPRRPLLWSWNRWRRPRAGKGRHCRQSVFLRKSQCIWVKSQCILVETRVPGRQNVIWKITFLPSTRHQI